MPPVAVYRLGVKVDGLRYGPASEGMDRFRVRVDERGVLFVDTSTVTLVAVARSASASRGC